MTKARRPLSTLKYRAYALGRLCPGIWVLGLLLAVAAGCVVQGEIEVADREIGPTAQEHELLGGTTFEDFYSGEDNCTPEAKEALRYVGIIGRTIAVSDAFEECVRERVDEPLGWVFEPCSNDSFYGEDFFYDKVMEAARSYNPVMVGCDAREDYEGDPVSCRGGVGCALPGEHGHDGYDEIRISGASGRYSSGLGYCYSLLEEAAQTYDTGDYGRAASCIAERAGTMWHEGMHTHGYYCMSGDCAESDTMGIPYLINDCVDRIWDESFSNCFDVKCDKPAQIPLISGWGETDCVCVRDPADHYDESVDEPVTPILGTIEEEDLFGTALAKGDFNDDGFPDLAVGIPGKNASTGAVAIYLGSFLGLYPRQLLDQEGLGSNEPGDLFGWSLAAGDFNDDGFTDLAVGAPGENESEGRVFLFHGSRSGLVPRRVYSQAGQGADEEGDIFGFSMVAGDFDQDYDTDLAVGAPLERIHDNTVQSGYVFILKGGQGPDGLEMWLGLSQDDIDEDEEGDMFGFSLAAGPTTTGNYSDLAVGAPGDSGRGKVFLFRNGWLLNDWSTYWNASRVLQAPDSDEGAMFGHALAIGEYHNTVLGSVAVSEPPRGYVHIFDNYGNLDQTIENGEPGFGISLATELNAPYDRLLIGSANPENSGAVFLYEGGWLQMTQERLYLQEPLGMNEVGDFFGYSLVVGDFSADGERDFFVGAPREKPGSGPDQAGAVFGFRGDPSLCFSFFFIPDICFFHVPWMSITLDD